MEKSLPQTTKATDVKVPHVVALLHELKLLTKGLVLYANVLPVLAGFLLAIAITGVPLVEHIDRLLITMLGSTFIVAGALIFNNWYEVDLDRHMKRTEKRPTVTGHLSLNTVLTLGIISSVVGLGLILFVSIEAAIYAFLGWFTYVVPYTLWTKRRTTLNTAVGSLSGAFTPLIGWAVIESAYHIAPITLFAVLFIWQMPHTFAITIRRYDDYKAAGVPMLPVVYGIPVTVRQIIIYVACLLPLPFFLTSLGHVFIAMMTTINLIWLGFAFRGLFEENHMKWANYMFYFSLTYLTMFFGMTILFSAITTLV